MPTGIFDGPRALLASGFDLAYLSVIVIGGFVGAVELLGRYLYAPVRAILTPSGVLYIVVNMAAAAAAFYMIGSHGFDVFKADEADAAQDLNQLKAVLLAGFGALAFMRSSIFKIRIGDSAIGIGPAAILDTLLVVADRGVDRQEAILRAREVTTLLRGADPVRGAGMLASYCLALMQNVTAEEQKTIQESVRKIAADETYDAAIRLDLIALELSNVVGPTVLEAAVTALGDRLKAALPGALAPIVAPAAAPPPAPPPPAPRPAAAAPPAGGRAPAPTAATREEVFAKVPPPAN
jgi:hypothetical protein